MKSPSSIFLSLVSACWISAGAFLSAQDGAAQTAALPAPASVIPASRAGDDLVPAAFGIWTDRAGSSWSVEAGGNIGRIGSSMVNSGLALLVNEEKFEPYQPMMTPDGKEMVLQGLPMDPYPGLQVQRRVRLLDSAGGLRYAELFHNGSADPLTVSIALTTNFSGNFKTFLSDRGRSEPLVLSPEETGVVVLPGTSQSSRAFLFTLAGSHGGVRPTVSSQNRYGLTFRYRLDLAPGGTAVILHHVAQVVIPRNFDRRTLADLSRPHRLEEMRGTLETDWLPSLENAPLASDQTASSAYTSGGIASLGIAPGPEDLLLIGDATRLAGKASADSLKIVSPHGEAAFPIARVAAIQGGKARAGGDARLFLRDGQVFSGRLEAPGLSFAPLNGNVIELKTETLDRLLFADAPVDLAWPAATPALIETHDGDRIRVPAGESPAFAFLTAWGRIEVKIGDLLWLRPVISGGPGWQIELVDGTRCLGMIDGDSISLSGSEAGEMELPASRVRQIFTGAGVAHGGGEILPPSGSLVRLAGDQRLAAMVGDTSFPIFSEGIALELPVSEVRRFIRSEEGTDAAGSARFEFERWDGGVVSGQLALEFLSVQVAGNPWRIPLRDVAGVDLASPALNSEALTRIEGLIRQLGSPDWATRESATRELGAFGYLARPVLQRELSATDDPEVERRLERVLSGLN